MRFDTTQHPFSCGIALHARTMDVGILDQSGAVLVHRNMQTDPELCLQAIAPYRPGMVIAVACMCTWDWLADLWADAGIPCVRGHALSMHAIHGGKATHDTIDAHKLAAVRRGGMRPQAYVSPAKMRATRDVRRRRMPLAHKRADLLAHGQNTHSQYTLPAMGTQSADQANREGVAERLADAAGQKSSAVDLALITSYDELLRAVARPLVNTAKPHDAHTRSLRPTVPGSGTRLSRVLLYDIPDVNRFPRGQDGVSSCRLGQGARASAGTRDGTAGAQIGKAHRQGALAAAAVVCLRDHPAAQKSRARWEKKPDTGTALTILAPKLARAVYDRLQRPGACEPAQCCQR